MKHSKHPTKKQKKLNDNWIVGLILALLYLVVACAFYLALIIGSAIIIMTFFTENTSPLTTIGIGLGFIAGALLANLCAVRIIQGKWRIYWPDLSFLWPFGGA